MTIPREVQAIAEELAKAGHQAHLVGGCLRDLLMEQAPKDWDITTDATPEEIQKLFPESVYENQFGTVGVKTGANEPTLALVEVTTFRKEGKYTDKRHPDSITFAKTVEEDLARRDFTINSIALELPIANYQLLKLIDPFKGQADIKKKLVRAVGVPAERFEEDALRLMRAVRLATQLEFTIEDATGAAIKKCAGLLEYISKERVRDELVKILLTPRAADGIRLLENYGLLAHVLSELREGIGMTQNKHHIYTVFDHNVRSLAYAAENNFPLDLRVASLLHDVGKPATKQGDGPDATFYSHQVVGAKMALKMLDRLHFPKNFVEKVALLVREHMFVYDPEVVTLRGVRRLLSRVGPENMNDLFKVREADRIGSGVPKAQPYRLRHLMAMVDKVKQDPISPKMLKISGTAIMELLTIPPGPAVGHVLSVLLEEVLDDPRRNTEKHLASRAKELGGLSEKKLRELAAQAKQSAADAQERIDSEIKSRYFVK